MTTDDIKKLLEVITQGEWFYEEWLHNDDNSFMGYRIHDGKTGYGDDTIAETIAHVDRDKEEQLPNAIFIAYAPSIVRQLLKANEELQRCYEVTNKTWKNMATENQRLIKALEKIASDESWDVGRQTIAIKTLRGE